VTDATPPRVTPDAPRLPRLEDYACGVCGRPSVMMFIHGYRCDLHAFQALPSQAVGGQAMIGVMGRLLKKPEGGR
jgi:hypothetical protein